ncbi:MIP/aquaporin family protein [Streptomyces sp. NPDC005248]|uniref:MIP/aquaporin family protein n=1 Tax=unclassified Streptomyces TaxID=2593676 RepID=UPI00369B4AE9
MSTVSSLSPPPRLARAADEFALTTVLLFLAVTVVRWLRDPDSALYVGDLDAALAVIGILSGAILTGLIFSPPGRRSGGHLNPAVTVSLWLMGAFPGRNVVPYALAQLAGSAAGTGLGRLVWGPAASLPSVDYAAIVPAPTWQPTSVFVAEAGSMTIIIVAVGFTMTHARHARLVPYVIGLSVALVIAVLGPRSGGSINPARQFGPAALAGQSTDLWIYLVAPVLGAVLGAWLHHLLGRRRPLTRKVAPGHAVTAEPPADRPRRTRHTTALHPGERQPDLQGRHHPSTAAGPQADGSGTRGGGRNPGSSTTS